MPNLYSKVKNEEWRYRDQLRRFEYDEPYDAVEIQGAFVGLLNAMLDRHLESNNSVFVMAPFEPGVGEHLVQVLLHYLLSRFCLHKNCLLRAVVHCNKDMGIDRRAAA